MSYKDLPDNTVLSIIAPTASGKTALVYELYETQKFELISVDSALIYQDMNIGTAKPTAEELIKYPHHLVDIISPEQHYNVAEFCQDVKNIIEKVHNNNKIPILVGGTMMYYMAMFEGISNVPTSGTETREKVKRWIEAEGIEALYNYLTKYDSVSAERLKISDTQRISRAVEVYLQTEKPLSEWQKLPKNAISDNIDQNWLAFNVIPDRSWLHERIELRLEQMWQQGFIREVIYLISNYQLQPDFSSVRCIGYRQVIDYLLAEKLVYIEDSVLKLSDFLQAACPLNDTDALDKITNNTCQDMKNKALYATRQLAKRQCTWLNKINNLPAKNNKVEMFSFKNIDNIKNKIL